MMTIFFRRLEERIRTYLSRRPRTYALMVGIGVVLFWRGVWHTADLVHAHWNYYQNNLSIDALQYPWWDGPWSFVIGAVILLFTGAFTSSFIGNELILSGLRGEKKLNQKEEHELESEAHSISQIRTSLRDVTIKLDKLEERIRKSH